MSQQQKAWRRRSARSLIIMFLIAQCLPAFAQTTRQRPASRNPSPRANVNTSNEIAAAVEELLTKRPLAPDNEANDSGTPNAAANNSNNQNDQDDDKPPTDDAPLKDLFTYWEGRNSAADGSEQRSEQRPSPRVAERLLAEGENRPWLLPQILGVLPDETATHERIYRVWQTSAPEAEWREQLQNWLRQRSNYFRDELVRETLTIGESGEGLLDLRALAKLDWNAAQPALQALPAEWRAIIEYEHALHSNDSAAAERQRKVLQEFIANPANAGSVTLPLTALFESDWSGKTDWYAGLFAHPWLTGVTLETNDQTANERKGGEDKPIHEEDAARENQLLQPLHDDPKTYVPIVARLVGDSNRIVQLGAIDALAQWIETHDEEIAKEDLPPYESAATALLPWLTNPAWVVDEQGENGRYQFLDGLEDLQLPAALSGLLWVVQYDEDNAARALAAQALIAYRTPTAIPALRQALEREPEEELREKFITALYQCGGIGDDEAAAAIEAFARKRITTNGAAEIEAAKEETWALNDDERTKRKPLPLPVSIGRVLHESETIAATEGLTVRLFERIRQTRRSNPPLAKALLETIQNVPLPMADLFFAERIGAGWIDGTALELALDRRDTMQQYAGDSLRQLAEGTGYAAGIATALLADPSRGEAILRGNDAPAQKALLAAARYLRQPLPVEVLGRLSTQATLRTAVTAYLQIAGSRAARELLWALHPNEALIVGEAKHLQAFESGSNYQRATDREAALETEIKAADAPLEIYALHPVLTYHAATSDGTEIRRWAATANQPERAELRIYRDANVWRTRALLPSELGELQALTTRADIETIQSASSNETEGNGRVLSYTQLQRRGGWRVLLRGFRPTPRVAPTPAEELTGFFYQLAHTGEFTWHHQLEKQFPKLTVLPLDERYQINALCQDEDKLRALVVLKNARRATSGEASELTWRAVNEDGLGATLAETNACGMPATFSFMQEMQRLTAEGKISSRTRSNGLSEAEVMISEVVIDNPRMEEFAPYARGLKLLGDDAKDFTAAIAGDDQKWVVALKRAAEGKDGRAATREQLVRVEVATKRVFPVSVPNNLHLMPVQWLAPQRKVLLKEPNGNDESGKFYLLDAATGALEAVTGTVRPLLERDAFRKLQPTGQPHEFWVALPKTGSNAQYTTRIGRYNALTFQFTTLLEVPGLYLKSAQIWVDKTQRQVWLLDQNLLLRVPLA